MAGKSKAARALAKRLAHEQLERLAGGTVSLFLWPTKLSDRDVAREEVRAEDYGVWVTRPQYKTGERVYCSPLCIIRSQGYDFYLTLPELRAPAYWQKREGKPDDGPFCPQCWESEEKVMRLHPGEISLAHHGGPLSFERLRQSQHRPAGVVAQRGTVPSSAAAELKTDVPRPTLPTSVAYVYTVWYIDYERRSMNEDFKTLMRQAVEREMHRKILLRAADLVAMGWTTGAGARNERGERVQGTNPGAISWCLTGAVFRALAEIGGIDGYRAERPASWTR